MKFLIVDVYEPDVIVQEAANMNEVEVFFANRPAYTQDGPISYSDDGQEAAIYCRFFPF